MSDNLIKAQCIAVHMSSGLPCTEVIYRQESHCLHHVDVKYFLNIWCDKVKESLHDLEEVIKFCDDFYNYYLGYATQDVNPWWNETKHYKPTCILTGLCHGIDLLTGDACIYIASREYSRCDYHARILKVFHTCYHIVSRDYNCCPEMVKDRVTYTDSFVEYCLRLLFHKLSNRVVDSGHRIQFRALAYLMFKEPFPVNHLEKIPPCFVARFIYPNDILPEGLNVVYSWPPNEESVSIKCWCDYCVEMDQMLKERYKHLFALEPMVKPKKKKNKLKYSKQRKSNRRRY